MTSCSLGPAPGVRQRKALFRDDILEGAAAGFREVCGGKLQLGAEFSAADYHLLEIQCGLVYNGLVLLLHSDGGAASADISGHGVDILDMHHFKRFLADCAGALFHVELLVDGQGENVVVPAFADGDEGLEAAVATLPEEFGDVYAVDEFVAFIKVDLIGKLELVQHAHCVCLDFFFLCHGVLLKYRNKNRPAFNRAVCLGHRDQISSSSSQSRASAMVLFLVRKNATAAAAIVASPIIPAIITSFFVMIKPP